MTDELKKQLSDALDKNWGVAKEKFKDTFSESIIALEASVGQAVQPVVEQGKAAVAAAEREYITYKGIAFDKLEEGRALAEEWPNVSVALGVGAFIVIVPATRRILYNQTILRLMSKQGRVNHVEKRASWLKEGLDTQTMEYEKLQERVALAEDEYLRGRAKLLAAGAQLRQLSHQAKRYQGQALELSTELRMLPVDAKALAGLRQQVDSSFYLARKQRNAMDSQLKRIVNNGVSV